MRLGRGEIEGWQPEVTGHGRTQRRLQLHRSPRCQSVKQGWIRPRPCPHTHTRNTSARSGRQPTAVAVSTAHPVARFVYGKLHSTDSQIDTSERASTTGRHHSWIAWLLLPLVTWTRSSGTRRRGAPSSALRERQRSLPRSPAPAQTSPAPAHASHPARRTTSTASGSGAGCDSRVASASVKSNKPVTEIAQLTMCGPCNLVPHTSLPRAPMWLD